MREDIRMEAEVRKKRRCNIALFEMEESPQAKEYRWPLEAGKGKQMDFPLEPPALCSPLDQF